MEQSALADLVAAELALPVDPRVAALAEAVAARHGAASRAVLFYGSCLRAGTLDGQMLDFYLIVSGYREAFAGRWLAAANRLLPPNVFPFAGDGLAAKYAVLSEADFVRLASSATRNVSVWARFAQPARLVWRADHAAGERAVAAVAGAAPALFRAARPLLPDAADGLDLWRGAFALTYAAELRAERNDRAMSVVDAEPERYRRFTAPALAAAGERFVAEGDQIRFLQPVTPSDRRRGLRGWARRRLEGKALSVARLAKATTTFAGGIDYIAWKINRHAGTQIALKPWQRRWPILAGFILLPRLLRGKAIR